MFRYFCNEDTTLHTNNSYMKQYIVMIDCEYYSILLCIRGATTLGWLLIVNDKAYGSNECHRPIYSRQILQVNFLMITSPSANGTAATTPKASIADGNKTLSYPRTIGSTIS